MSHWFHRNVLKATALVGFSDVLNGPFYLTKLGRDLKRCREKLLGLLPDPSHSVDTINMTFLLFLSFMSGFFLDYKISGKKIRYAFAFKWTHSLLDPIPQIQQDSAFDVANMSVNVAIWFMKHAALVASKKSVSMEDAKEIHTSLRKAAGIFQMVLKEIIILMEPGSAGGDLDPRVLNAYLNQCIAEAQEVTIAREIVMRHNSTLISALSYENSKSFEKAEIHLRGLDKSLIEQWSLYLQIKKFIYLAYAYYYFGKYLQIDCRCGEAIRALKETQAYYEKALSLCKLYSKVKGPAKPVKPDGHLFFTGINAAFSTLLERCELENHFMYQHTVPDFPSELTAKAPNALASPETYNLPPPAPLWELAFEKQDQLLILKDSSLKVGPSKKGKELSLAKEVDYLEN